MSHYCLLLNTVLYANVCYIIFILNSTKIFCFYCFVLHQYHDNPMHNPLNYSLPKSTLLSIRKVFCYIITL